MAAVAIINSIYLS